MGIRGCKRVKRRSAEVGGGTACQGKMEESVKRVEGRRRKINVILDLVKS